MASEKAKELWESGIWLNEAWKAFAPAQLATQFEDSQGFFQAFNEGPIPNDMTGLGRKAFNAISRSQKRQVLEKAMKEAVLVQLFNNDLIATGYREFPSPSRNAIAIESGKFEFDEPDWSNQSLSAQGLKYGRIKVSRPLQSPRSSAKEKCQITVIDKTIDTLKLSNPAFCTQLRKKSSQEVRDLLGFTHTQGNGLSDKNIERAILRKCGPKRIGSKLF